ncbi:hypothetical protein SprV_0401551100 [Sparganum proliferum]
MRCRCSLDELKKAARIFVGEAFAMCVVTSASILSRYGPATSNSSAAFSVGAAVYAATWVVGPVSGANINSMVTLANVALRRIPLQYLLLYWLGQLLGGVLGFLFAFQISPFVKSDPLAGVIAPAPGVSDVEAFGCETFITFLLVTSVLSGFEELRPSEWNSTSGVRMAMIVGLVTTLLILIGIYLVGPLLGTLAAIILHELFFCPDASLARLRALLTKREFSRHVSYTETTDSGKAVISISSAPSHL